MVASSSEKLRERKTKKKFTSWKTKKKKKKNVRKQTPAQNCWRLRTIRSTLIPISLSIWNRCAWGRRSHQSLRWSPPRLLTTPSLFVLFLRSRLRLQLSLISFYCRAELPIVCICAATSMFALAQHNTFFFTENQEITGTEHNTFLQIRRRKKQGRKQTARIRQSPAIVCIEVCAATSMLTSTRYNRFSFTEKQK